MSYVTNTWLYIGLYVLFEDQSENIFTTHIYYVLYFHLYQEQYGLNCSVILLLFHLPIHNRDLYYFDFPSCFPSTLHILSSSQQ